MKRKELALTATWLAFHLLHLPACSQQSPPHELDTHLNSQDRDTLRNRHPPEVFFANCGILPLSMAIYLNDANQIKTLATSDLDLNEQGHCGITLLIWSLLCRNYDCIQTLLDHGAEPSLALTAPIEYRSIYLHDGDNFLSASLKLLRPDLLQLSLPYSQDPTRTDRHGQNLIHIYVLSRASEYYDTPIRTTEEIISDLISAGVDINQRSHSGHTALHHTIDHGPHLAVALLNRGADPLIVTNDGSTLPQLLEEIMTREPNRKSPKYRPLIQRLANMNLFDPATLQSINIANDDLKIRN